MGWKWQSHLKVLLWLNSFHSNYIVTAFNNWHLEWKVFISIELLYKESMFLHLTLENTGMRFTLIYERIYIVVEQEVILETI